jgi:DNA-binding LacI/PurR family transcriptional regulator
VALAADVSPAAASDIINRGRAGLYTPETRARVVQAAKALGYTPNRAAQRMRQSKVPSVAIVLTHHLANPFLGRLIFRAETRLESVGADTILIVGSSSVERRRPVIDTVQSHAPHGVLIGPVYGSDVKTLDLLAQLKQTAMPVVSFGTVLAKDGVTHAFHDEQSGALAVDYLIECGHRRIGFIGAPAVTDVSKVFGFGAGVADRLRQVGLLNAEWFTVAADRGDYGTFSKAAQAWVRAWQAKPIDARPTVLVCKNDQLAIVLLKVLGDAGVRVPRDLSIIGFDNMEEGAYTRPALTTVDNHVGAVIDAAVDHVLAVVAGDASAARPIKVQAQQEIVTRESVRRLGPTAGDDS